MTKEINNRIISKFLNSVLFVFGVKSIIFPSKKHFFKAIWIFVHNLLASQNQFIFSKFFKYFFLFFTIINICCDNKRFSFFLQQFYCTLVRRLFDVRTYFFSLYLKWKYLTTIAFICNNAVEMKHQYKQYNQKWYFSFWFFLLVKLLKVKAENKEEEEK